MKIEVTQDQKQKYKEEGLVTVHDLIPEKLFTHLQSVQEGHNQYRNDRNVERLLLHKNVGELTHSLSTERPIRLVFNEVKSKGRLDYRKFPFQGLLIVMVIPFSDNTATFFAADSDLIINETSMIGVYGINETLLIHSQEGQYLVKNYKQNGYNFGDRLKSVDSPFVYR